MLNTEINVQLEWYLQFLVIDMENCIFWIEASSFQCFIDKYFVSFLIILIIGNSFPK